MKVLFYPEFPKDQRRFQADYGCTGDILIFGAIIPTRSDPLNWLTRFRAH